MLSSTKGNGVPEQFVYLLVVFCVFVQDGNNKTVAKIVDLDAQAQRFSEIWGWRLQIGDFFSADYTPVPFQYAWSKLTCGGGNASIGTVYQSVLSNIQWMDNSNRSPFIKQLQDTMKNDNIESDKLSIRFNIDLYGLLTAEPKITGRIVGKSNGLYTREMQLHLIFNFD